MAELSRLHACNPIKKGLTKETFIAHVSSADAVRTQYIAALRAPCHQAVLRKKP